MKSHRPLFRTLVLAGALLATSSAFAGFQTGQSVVIIDASHLANGDLGFVYNSADRAQYIGCYSYDTSAGSAGVCFAQNTAGIYRSCYTPDANMVATIRSLGTDSYLIFNWGANGLCTFVEVENDSTTAPKK
jgi:hypothetical protein